ncbi:MAG: hypothetical protein SVY10_13255 [Thermodesulfobacteriota bacterium]|nr:hypothetical protein [Thermodesulfobacteriota bacterium]
MKRYIIFLCLFFITAIIAKNLILKGDQPTEETGIQQTHERNSHSTSVKMKRSSLRTRSSHDKKESWDHLKSNLDSSTESSILIHPTDKSLIGPNLRTSSTSGKETLFPDMDSVSLALLVRNGNATDENRRQALFLLLDRTHEEDSKTVISDLLFDIKDNVQEEDQQFLLKAMHNFADLGGNEAIVDSFFKSKNHETEVDRYRMLSYLDPMYPLDENTVDRLTEAYIGEKNTELSLAILDTIGTVCGEQGISWIIDRAYVTDDQKEWDLIIGVLGRSDSQLALNWLNEFLNEGIDDATRREKIRQAILQLKRN